MVRKPRRGGVAEENEVVERRKKRVSFVSGRGNETSGGGEGGLGGELAGMVPNAEF